MFAIFAAVINFLAAIASLFTLYSDVSVPVGVLSVAFFVFFLHTALDAVDVFCEGK